jgi:hypothetical protein
MRPDFTAMKSGILVLKCEAKVRTQDLLHAQEELAAKFHPTAFRLFPRDIVSIPALTTAIGKACLCSLTYHNACYNVKALDEYDFRGPNGLSERVRFIVDMVKIARWILTLEHPQGIFHLPPGVRVETRNHNHVTFLAVGILKEFKDSSCVPVIGKIYEQVREIKEREVVIKLPNIEWGKQNCTSITIERVGLRLSQAIREQEMSKEYVFAQVSSAVAQLHSIGYAHCDICIQNIFVDSTGIFLGDLEYCRPLTDAAPTTLARSNARARTAEDLDNLQLQALQDELARM